MSIKATWKRAVFFLLCGLIVFRTIQFVHASSIKAPQAYLVLGGSPFREIYAAKLKKLHPERLVVISSGSPDPCLVLIFRQEGSPMTDVWSEKCAQNTFENVTYNLQFMEKHGVRKVAVITDFPQLKRAMPVAQIIFASHGMVAELAQSPQNMMDEKSNLELGGLVILACCWAVLSQVYQPNCSNVTPLSTVDMDYWYKTGFTCQPQSGIVPCIHPPNAPPPPSYPK